MAAISVGVYSVKLQASNIPLPEIVQLQRIEKDRDDSHRRPTVAGTSENDAIRAGKVIVETVEERDGIARKLSKMPDGGVGAS
jgi:hypothetical protein